MKTRVDFAKEDESLDYCRYCAKSDGSMQSYEEKLTSMTGFIMRTKGMAEDAAQSTAKGMMAKLPAWKDHSSNQ